MLETAQLGPGGRQVLAAARLGLGLATSSLCTGPATSLGGCAVEADRHLHLIEWTMKYILQTQRF